MATTLQPIPMGIIVSVVFGLALTAPISSAALAAMVFTVAEGEVMGEGLLLAAGAATAGCCAQMVGFAVASYRENRVAGLIAQGIGTSMPVSYTHLHSMCAQSACARAMAQA